MEGEELGLLMHITIPTSNIEEIPTSAMHIKKPPSSDRAADATAFRACKIATNKEPKQTDPKDVVRVRMTLPITPPEQQPESCGENHQLPTVPLTVT
jgi:hypothetical protein